jgi:hypothetical protein
MRASSNNKGVGNLKNKFLTRTAAVFVAASFILLGSVAATPAIAAPAGSQSSVTSQAPTDVAGTLATWTYYDGSKITSAPKCASRLSYLRANVDWIKTSNSRCQEFKSQVCGGSTSYWMVMVLAGTGARVITLPESAPAAELEALRC